MQEVRWQGPYVKEPRHADDVTIDHLIELRKRVALLESQLDNVLSWVKPMQRSNEQMKAALEEIVGGSKLVLHPDNLTQALQVLMAHYRKVAFAALKEGE
jgi:hypothetical protein